MRRFIETGIDLQGPNDSANYYPSFSGRLDPKDQLAIRHLYDRVNYVLDRVGKAPDGTTPQRTIDLHTQVRKLSVALQAVQDSLVQSTTFVGFGNSQPVSTSLAISGSGIGYIFTESSPGILTMSVASASTARSAIGAAASGANTDLTSITGLTGAVQAAANNAINWGRAAVSMPADANYTLIGSEYNKLILTITSAAALTATRDIVLPTLDGRAWIVNNATSGGQSIVARTVAGTGVTIANGSTGLVYGDGTDIKDGDN